MPKKSQPMLIIEAMEAAKAVKSSVLLFPLSLSFICSVIPVTEIPCSLSLIWEHNYETLVKQTRPIRN